MPVVKVVPVVLRRQGDRFEVLVFEHPLAGTQLVKGNVEAGEAIAAAAARELLEESGVIGAVSVRELGAWHQGPPGQVWHFCEMATSSLPNTWDHDTADDGGHRFTFWWHPIAERAPPSCSRIFVDALAFVQQHVAADLASSLRP
ncbi:NUDIX domain-containing protein [Gemmatimonas aurantiaca]|uniref:NUDIX domain-containing protein n=1 Tax=Gemmatimonas aurantiaca TaxID=173480 RepID=UPI00301CA183